MQRSEGLRQDENKEKTKLKHTQQVMNERNKRLMVHNSYCPLVLTKGLSPVSAAALLFSFPFVLSLRALSLSSLPLILSDTTVLLFYICRIQLPQLSSRAGRDTLFET